jgi:hypothetical protein
MLHFRINALRLECYVSFSLLFHGALRLCRFALIDRRCDFSVLPAFLDGLTYTLGVFSPVVFVEIRSLDVRRGASVRVVE